MREAVSRRTFLKSTGAVAGVLLLAACSGTPAAPTAPPASSGSSSSAPTPAATAAAAAPAGAVTLRLAHWQTGVSAELFNKVYAAFEAANPTIKISQEVSPFDQHFERLQVAFAGGNAPDVFHSSGAYFLNFAEKGVLLDISNYITRDKVDFNGIWTEDDEMKYKGQWYSMPIWNTNDVMYYNKTLFDKAGAKIPTDDWTWDDMLAAAKQITSKGANGKVDVWGVQIPNGVQGGWGAMVFANDGDWMNADRTKTTLDQPKSMEAMQFIYDLMQTHKVMPTDVDNQALTQAGVTDPFVSSKIAMYVAITSAVPNYLKNAKFDWDIAFIPKAPKTGKNGSAYIVQPGNISKSTKHPEESWKLLAFHASEQAQKILATDKIKFVVNKKAAMDTNGGYSTPPPANIKRAVQTMDFAKDLRFIRKWSEYQQKISDELSKAYLGQSTMADAVKAAVAAGDKVLAES